MARGFQCHDFRRPLCTFAIQVVSRIINVRQCCLFWPHLSPAAADDSELSDLFICPSQLQMNDSAVLFYVFKVFTRDVLFRGPHANHSPLDRRQSYFQRVPISSFAELTQVTSVKIGSCKVITMHALHEQPTDMPQPYWRSRSTHSDTNVKLSVSIPARLSRGTKRMHMLV